MTAIMRGCRTDCPLQPTLSILVCSFVGLMPLSAVIVDDEQLARDELAFLLKSVDDVNVVAQGKNGAGSRQPDQRTQSRPGLPRRADARPRRLRRSSRSCWTKKSRCRKIVFATAFDQYAVKAFEVNAVDYLLKPFDKKRVAQSVQKARAKTAMPLGLRPRVRDAGAHAGIAEAAPPRRFC